MNRVSEQVSVGCVPREFQVICVILPEKPNAFSFQYLCERGHFWVFFAHKKLFAVWVFSVAKRQTAENKLFKCQRKRKSGRPYFSALWVAKTRYVTVLLFLVKLSVFNGI